MVSIQHTMTDDHKRCDSLLTRAEELAANKDWENAQQQLAEFCQAMKQHFDHEEQILFPAFETTTGNSNGPTMMMRHEHEQIRELMQAMTNALQEKNLERYLGLSETLLIYLQQHNMKEEGILYPMIDNYCAAQADELMKPYQKKLHSDAA